ncbi:hypothetical protein B0T17DRAFT_489254 [Bombardia bombarda]|uniref:SH3 domain-containing protein n=1 Tax=Bombardia bombarda TaxID=252184 RepID=A0AA40CA25_9PEZI|nr:hypothetical protein B0T17DRAFT_489254 [Bombardia bombarda]
MTRPEIIRADSIDLQDRDAPSTSTQGHPKSAADGSLAPHQAETLREVAAETAEHRRISWVNNGDVGDLQQYAEDLASGVTDQQSGRPIVGGNTKKMPSGSQQDALAIAQNGGLAGHEADDDDDMDGETEVDMDDDMMDKISSSPSIEDGGSTCALPRGLPRSLNSSCQSVASCSPPASPLISDARSSSPYLALPDHLPLNRQEQRADMTCYEPPNRHHHLYGEFENQGPARDELPSHDRRYDDRDCNDCSGHNEPAQPDEQYDLEIYEEEDYIAHDLADDSGGIGEAHGEYITAAMGTHRMGGHGMDPKFGQAQEDAGRDQDCYDDNDDSNCGLTVPYESDEDDDGDFSTVDDSRFVDSGWGGECLQDTEDIDFDFVYALHTFVATVEGQANATKGDTMVLLDDSNSYWWLVRVVKDSSIGYLPAEHIETPTERLARLNKHRNIDLSASMLGDQAEKSRNPLKSAIKRRKTKTVQFAAPTYVNYSDNDYSTDEEDLEAAYFAQQQQQQGQQAQQTTSQQEGADTETDDVTAKIEPLRPKSQKEAGMSESNRLEGSGEADPTGEGRDSEDMFDGTASDGPKKTSDGTVRDSFFKDDTVETKKITLTPNLLRDDNAPRTSNDSRELKQRVSLDKLDKESLLGKDDKKKKDKKEKDKKPSAIRSFFSRKDKKAKGDEDDDSFGKRSMDADNQEKEIEEDDLGSSPEKASSSGPQRHPSKLQKQQPRTEPSPTRKPGNGTAKESGMDLAAFLSEGKVSNVANVPPASMRVVSPESSLSRSPEASRIERSNSAGMAPSRAPREEVRPIEATTAKSQSELDDFDSDEDYAPEAVRQAPVQDDMHRQQQQRSAQGTSPDAHHGSEAASDGPKSVNAPAVTIPPQRRQAERLSESPVQVSPVNVSNPPPLMIDTSSQEEDRSSSRSTPSPELISHEESEMHSKKDSIASSSSTTTMSSWNDVNLRAFFDSGTDIRDLLAIVYDKTDAVPAGPEHPVAGSIFREQNAKLAEITTQLDNMLGDWLARKQRLQGTV